MKPARGPIRSDVFGILILLQLFTVSAFAQQPKVLAPHKPIMPRVPKALEQYEPGTLRSMVGGFWMIDANRKASIYLRNGMTTSPLTVQPSLYLSNGARYRLAAITLEASGTAVVNINDALRQKGIAPWAPLSGYVEVEYTWAWDPLCVSVTSTDPIHSVIFTSGLQPSVVTDLRFHLSKPQMQGMYAVDGLWWKPEAGVRGFVALNNTTAESVSARVQMTDELNNPVAEYAVRISPHGTKIVSLSAMDLMAVGTAGGIRVLHTGTEEGVLINGGLEDDVSGYSANLAFHYRFASAPQPSAPEIYAELGLMMGAADPMMLFPTGTEFTPFSVARNISNEPLAIKPTVHWMQGGEAHSVMLHTFTLMPFEAQNIDIHKLLANAGLSGFSGSLNLILQADGQSRSLLLASGSVDQRNTYVFQVVPHGIQESSGKAISYWSTANGDDTMVTLWNPADEPQDYRFTLFFAGGQYTLPIHLGARSTRMFNVSQIIENQTPDENGSIIPPNVHEGSAKVSGIHADNEDILVAVDAGTYNVRKATCSYYCISCDGEVLTYVVLSPFTMAKGKTNQLTFTIKTNTGSQYSTTGTWSSSNTAIATVNSGTGLTSGVGVGTSTLSAYTNSTAVYNSNYCAYDPYCPYYAYASGSGPGTVAPPLSITNVSPSNLIRGASGPMTITGSGFTHYPGAPSIGFTGTGIAVSSVTIVNDTTIRLNYSVACSAAAQSLSVYFPGADSGSAARSNYWSLGVIWAVAPGPRMLFGGGDITATTVSVVVGQQILLTSSQSLPACLSVASQSWSVPGETVGGYTAAVSGGFTTATNFAGPSTTFYWITSASSQQVTYSSTLNSGQSGSATATFNISGPVGATVATSMGSVQILGSALSLGNPSATAGIKFTASATSQPTGGTYKWAQLIPQFHIVYTNSTSTDTCDAGVGIVGIPLDNIYPYATGLVTKDSPNIALTPSNFSATSMTTSFSAQMFVLWNPGLANAIDVPLGSVTWQWAGAASLSGSTWTKTSGSHSANAFSASSAFPQWTTTVFNGTATCSQ